MLGYWPLVTGNFYHNHMIILDDIEEDQFLKVRGIEVLLIEDAGDRKKEHLYHVPTNQHIRNLASSKTVCLICPSSFNTTVIQPAIQTKCNNLTLFSFLQYHPKIILPRWEFLLLPTITCLVQVTFISLMGYFDSLLSSWVPCSDVARVILLKDQSDHVIPLLKQQNKNFQLLSIACTMKSRKL